MLQRIEYMLPAPNSAAMIATPTNLIRTIFEWLDKDKNGVIEECELTTGLSVKPAETAVVQSMLGSFPNGLLSHAGFGEFQLLVHCGEVVGARRLLSAGYIQDAFLTPRPRQEWTAGCE